MSYCDVNVLVQVTEMGGVPLHMVQKILKSNLVSGFFKVAVHSLLPVKGVAFLLENDIAGEILPFPEVDVNPMPSTNLDSSLVSIFPACVVT